MSLFDYTEEGKYCFAYCGDDLCNCGRNRKNMESEKLDPIVESVRAKMLERSQVGLAKYGVGLDREDLDTLQWLKHFQEELMDAANYVEVLIQRLESE